MSRRDIGKEKAVKQSTKIILIACVVLAVVIAACGIGVGVYAGTYSRAEEIALEAMATGETYGDYTVFDGGGDTGLVFYPGGKVEAAAYAPLLRRLADVGVTCVLAEMPLNLAVLDAKAWEEAVTYAPAVKTWYIGGHSLGGAMAASSATAENGFAGLVLLAAYPTDTVDLPTLSIYGSEDGVMDREKYAEGLTGMSHIKEVVITGGNHAQFGYYGEQKGDGHPTTEREAQIAITVSEILNFINQEK